MFFEVALIAYIIDFIFSEFQKLKFLKHPIIFMGEYISWFEKRFYKDSIFCGFLLCISLVFIVFSIEKYVVKGKEIAVEGKLTHRSYDDKNGEKRYVTEIIANEVLLLSK